MSLEVSPTAVVSMVVGTLSLSQYGVDASFMSLLLHECGIDSGPYGGSRVTKHAFASA
jgi:hypothetical protein